MEKVTLIGAGLSGSLLAILLAKRGFDVTVYERRPDRRIVSVDAGRSINLAVSARGIHALTVAGVFDEIQKIATPMYGRMNHPLGGIPVGTMYSVNPQNCLFSVSRPRLNEVLMDAAEKAGAKILFNQRCEDIDLQTDTVTFTDVSTDTPRTYSITATRVIGCDGANSALRKAMTRNTDFHCTETPFYVNYKELTIPAAADGSIQMEKNWLHIWGREAGAFMMIALPNIDNTFTCTMFMPVSGEKSMENIHTEAQVTDFFQQYFPDAVPLMPTLLEDYAHNPVSPLNIVVAYPWVVGGKLALVGDACHAVVPFYGQGVNASFEDCLELDKCMEFYPDWEKVFAQYQRNRKANSDAISQMAQENFEDMSKSGMPEFQLRKRIEHELEKRFADFHSQYELVSFSLQPYTLAQQTGRRNQTALSRIIESLPSVQTLGLDAAISQKGFDGLLAEVEWEISMEKIRNMKLEV